ncbi:MAG TPA: SpoIIE family protein phosphatase [Pyrinomonadaceae bacterium]|jgi:sigma-B regulation protein RsbU (phosphoserine phosphatase)|nr:SpoIIE family protein phosphatase [Pyrinomonadaceae bacterium]
MGKRVHAASDRFKRTVRIARETLRRVMPRVAMTAALSFALWLLVRDSRVYRALPFGTLLGPVTFLLVCFTLAYYGFKTLRWLKRRLLWRVRRRLAITYLFVGLTPIVLLVSLGLLSAFGGSGQAMARIVTAQFNTTQKQAQSNARTLADAFSNLPPNATDQAIQTWLDERTSLLQSSLPGARVALWRGAQNGDDAEAVGHNSPAQFVSESISDYTRAVGNDPTPTGAPLPEWLRGRAEWSGLAYAAPVDEKEKFASASVRAMTRGASGGRAFTLLLVVPVSRALIEQQRETTGIYFRPYFVDPGLGRRTSQAAVRAADKNGKGEPKSQPANEEEAFDQRVEDAFRKDQFGERPGEGTVYPVVLPLTNWQNGMTRESLSFIFDWSWTLAGKQFLGSTSPGVAWRKGLTAVGITFLVLELLALVAAAWMTRAVTGTVHKLYRATEFIKRGDFSHRVRVRSQDQLGELAGSFNDMAANIESLLHERVERERLEREVEIAADVQAQLFPRRVPDLATVHISADCRAARGVAGDYYDYIEIAPGLVAVALGDVAGKGVSAALVMSNLQAALRAQTTITAERLNIAERAVAVSAAGGGGQLLAHVVADAGMDGAVSRMTANINEQLCQSTDSNRFATLFLAIYEERTRTLRYTNAGHNAPLLVRADGEVERLVAGGIMVGAFDWARYEESSVKLRKDDLLVIFSDGITEVERADGEEYGEERLRQLAVKHRRMRAEQLQRAIFDDIESWSGTEERNDDQTLVIVKSN